MSVAAAVPAGAPQTQPTIDALANSQRSASARRGSPSPFSKWRSPSTSRRGRDSSVSRSSGFARDESVDRGSERGSSLGGSQVPLFRNNKTGVESYTPPPPALLNNDLEGGAPAATPTPPRVPFGEGFHLRDLFRHHLVHHFIGRRHVP